MDIKPGTPMICIEGDYFPALYRPVPKVGDIVLFGEYNGRNKDACLWYSQKEGVAGQCYRSERWRPVELTALERVLYNVAD